MLRVFDLIRRAAAAKLPVVIVGETGTGKELVARAVHALSHGENAPFIDINCAAIPENLLEAELFGWERGAFTGAHAANAGLMSAANCGTLFLDEACSLSLCVQAKLLRAIELGEFRRIGARKLSASTFRTVAATSSRLLELAKAGRFRSDLAYRLEVISIALPRLRDRGQDVRLLAQAFLAAAGDGARRALMPDAIAALRQYDWPGNVRELRSLIDRLVALTDEQAISGSTVRKFLPAPDRHALTRDRLIQLLTRHRGAIGEVLASAGMSRATLYRRLDEYGIDPRVFRISPPAPVLLPDDPGNGLKGMEALG